MHGASVDVFDFIIVGAGSAGCVLANRLSASGASVLLLEAGSWDRDPLIRLPIGVGKIFPSRLHDWNYFHQPDDHIDGRAIECARGKVVGGCSSVNVMAYVRGHRGDFDRWASFGLPEWSYENVLPYFRRSESWEGGGDAYRGSDGPLKVQTSRYEDPLVDSFIAAGQAAGYPATPDYNGASQEGFARVQETIHRGRRMSSAQAYLRPALGRANLKVEVEAHVTRLDLENGRVTGLTYRRGGQTIRVQARREVILSGGVINSPQLLMLSGIGDAQDLKRHGLDTVLHLPGVGKNLQDHFSFLATYKRKDTSPFFRAMRYDRLALAMARALLLGDGFAADVPIGATAFLKSRPDVDLPDLQFLFLAAPFPTHPYFRPFIQPGEDGFGCRVAVLRPQSRGSVMLASADPMDAPLIDQNFLATEGDRQVLRAGLSALRRVMAQPQMQAYADFEKAPGKAVVADDEIDAFVRRTGVTVHHPASTCKMGPETDPMAVVDSQMRLRGVSNLRIVDASVMPDLVGGNINAVVMMMAEKAADQILGRPAAPPAHLS